MVSTGVSIVALPPVTGEGPADTKPPLAIRSVSLITGALCDALREARAQMPVRGDGSASDDEGETFSAGEGDGASDDDRKRRRPRRKRKARPEAIAARLKQDPAAPSEGGDAGA